MRKTRISFSINKKWASKSDGAAETVGQPSSTTTTTDVTSARQEPTVIPSSYFACRFCCKRMKSEEGYETHSKTKSHAKAVKNGRDSEHVKTRSCGACQQIFASRPLLVEHCRRVNHMPLVCKTSIRNPVYGKAYTEAEQEDPFVTIKYYSPYYCEACDLDCVSDVHYQDHMKGDRHHRAMEKRNAQQGGALLVDLDSQEVDTSEMCLIIMNKVESAPAKETVSPYYCGICDVDCRSEVTYTEHVTGKEHQVRLEGHGNVKITCEMCCMSFTNKNNHKMHLRSKKHTNNMAAKQRLLPVDVIQGGEGTDSVQDLRDKIKRTLSPPLETFDTIKVNVVAAPGPGEKSNEESQRSVVIDHEAIEAEEAVFMEMARPNAGGGGRKRREKWDKKDAEIEKKLKEDAEERRKCAKKKEEKYAARKKTNEVAAKLSDRDSGSKEPSRREPRQMPTRGARDTRGRGGRARGGRGRGGRFSSENTTRRKKYGDENEKRSTEQDDSDYRERNSKNEKRGDRGDSRDSKGEKRERRRSEETGRDGKKKPNNETKKAREERNVNSSPSPPAAADDDDDLRNVINKQRGRATRSSNVGRTEYETMSSGAGDDDERGGAADDDSARNVVFEYGHQHFARTRDEESRDFGERTDLKGFFGGALSSLANHFRRPDLGVERERYYEEQRAWSESPRFQRRAHVDPPPAVYDKVAVGEEEEREEERHDVEKQLLLELLKRQFPDIRFLTQQQGGVELLQRIFGDVTNSRAPLGTSHSFSDGSSASGGISASGMGGGRAGSEEGSGWFGGRLSSVVHGDGMGTNSGLQRRRFADEGDIHNFPGNPRAMSSPVEEHSGKVMGGVRENNERSRREARSKELVSSSDRKETTCEKTKDDDKECSGKKKAEKNPSKDKGDTSKERRRIRTRSLSRERRKRKRSRSSSSSSRESKHSSRKRSRSRSRGKSSSKKSKRSPSPARSSKKDNTKSKRKASVSPPRRGVNETRNKDDRETSEKNSRQEMEKKNPAEKGKRSSALETKPKTNDAKEKVLSKWTSQNWSGKDKGTATTSEADEGSQRYSEDDEDEESALERYGRKDEKIDGKETSKRNLDDRKVISKDEKLTKSESQGKGESKKVGEMNRKKEDKKIFEDASDFEKSKPGKSGFQDQYDKTKPPRQGRRENVRACVVASDRDSRAVTASRYDSQPRSIPAVGTSFAESASGGEKPIPRMDDLRISENMEGVLGMEYDHYSYENRAFDSQDNLERPSARDMAALLPTRIPYANLGYQDFGAEQTLPGNYFPVVAVPPAGGLALGRGVPASSTTAAVARGRTGARNTASLMYIQLTDADSHQEGPGSSERIRASRSRVVSSQASRPNVKSTPSMIGSVLKSISAAPGEARTAGDKDHDTGDSSHTEVPSEEDSHELLLQDSDQYNSDMLTSKPLKSILKKQSRFSAASSGKRRDGDDVLVSGNLPKSAVGAEYVVQSSGEQGKFFCQLCDMEFMTLSARNLHLRGPKHLAMFMKHKSPLIDQMIQQAMGKTTPSNEDTMGKTTPSNEDIMEKTTRSNEDTVGKTTPSNEDTTEVEAIDFSRKDKYVEMEQQRRGAIAVDEEQTATKADPDNLSPHLLTRQRVVPLRKLETDTRGAEVVGPPSHTYPLKRSHSKFPEEEKVLDQQKAQGVVQSEGYQRSESMSRQGEGRGEGSREDYFRLFPGEERQGLLVMTRGKNDEHLEDRFVAKSVEYGGDYSKDTYGEPIDQPTDDRRWLQGRQQGLHEPRGRRYDLASSQHDEVLPRHEYRLYHPKDLDPPPDECGQLSPPDSRTPANDYHLIPHKEREPPMQEYHRHSPKEIRPGQVLSRGSYSHPPMRENYPDDQDWQQSSRHERQPPPQHEKRSDPYWQDQSTRLHGPPRDYPDEMTDSSERGPQNVYSRSRYVLPEKGKVSPSQENIANRKDVPMSGNGLPKDQLSGQPVRQPQEPHSQAATAAKNEPMGADRKREGQDLYGGYSPYKNYDHRAYHDRNYRNKGRYGGQDPGYAPPPFRRDDPRQTGHGHEPPRRGLSPGNISHGDPNSSGRGPYFGSHGGLFSRGRGSSRGYFARGGINNKPARRSWRSGQGQY